MKKKISSIIISGILAACMIMLLAACGGNTEKPASDPAAAGSGSAVGSGSESAAALSELEAIKAAGVIVVGITDFAPMDYKENGEWVGFDADFARLYAEQLGVEVQFEEIDWDNKILELSSGSVDCIWNGMTLTSEVAEAMACSNTYALNAQVVVMAKDKLANFKDEASMKDLSFAVEAGSAGETVAADAGLNVNPVQSQAAALMEVAAGTSDACVIDKTMADAMTGDGTSYPDLGYEVSLSSEEYVVGFRQGSDMVDDLNKWIKTWKEDGTLKGLSEKYDNAVSIAE